MCSHTVSVHQKAIKKLAECSWLRMSPRIQWKSWLRLPSTEGYTRAEAIHFQNGLLHGWQQEVSVPHSLLAGGLSSLPYKPLNRAVKVFLGNGSLLPLEWVSDPTKQGSSCNIFYYLGLEVTHHQSFPQYAVGYRDQFCLNLKVDCIMVELTTRASLLHSSKLYCIYKLYKLIN